MASKMKEMVTYKLKTKYVSRFTFTDEILENYTDGKATSFVFTAAKVGEYGSVYDNEGNFIAGVHEYCMFKRVETPPMFELFKTYKLKRKYNPDLSNEQRTATVTHIEDNGDVYDIMHCLIAKAKHRYMYKEVVRE